MSMIAVDLLFRYNKQLGNRCLANYYSGTNLPEFTFKTYQIEQMYAYKVIKNLEELNDGISLPDIYHFIDMSLPFTKDDVTILEQEIIQQHQAH